MAMNVFTGPALEESVSAVTDSPSIQVGTRRWYQGEEYVYCYNQGTGTAPVSRGVKLATGASGYTVAVTTATDAFNPCVGVVKHAAITSSSYGWVMVKGFCNVTVASASTADYKGIALGAASGIFVEASGTSTIGTALCIGYLVSHNTAASGQAYAFIRTNA